MRSHLEFFSTADVKYMLTVLYHRQTLMALKYVPEASEVVGMFELYWLLEPSICCDFVFFLATTKRRQLVVWKHEQTAATVTLPSKKSFECLSYSKHQWIIYGTLHGYVHTLYVFETAIYYA